MATTATQLCSRCFQIKLNIYFVTSDPSKLARVCSDCRASSHAARSRRALAPLDSNIQQQSHAHPPHIPAPRPRGRPRLSKIPHPAPITPPLNPTPPLAERLRGRRRRRGEAFHIDEDDDAQNSDTGPESEIEPPPRRRQRGRPRNPQVEHVRRPRGRRRNPPPPALPSAHISNLHLTVVHDLGPLGSECKHCKALLWPDERVNRTIKNEDQWEFQECCGKGSVSLTPLEDPPSLLRDLFESDTSEARHFRNNILYYNNALTFTSCRWAGSNERLDALHGGIKPFSIRGEVYHMTGPLEPSNETLPSFAQTYFYDPQFVTDGLLAQGKNNTVLRRDLLLRLREMLRECRNPFIDIYKTAKDCLDEAPTDSRDIILNPQMKLMLQDGFNKQRTNIPTSTEIAVIIPEETEKPTCRDIVIARRAEDGSTAHFSRIDKTHPAYMPLHYVLFFPTGRPGWGYSIEREDAELRIRKRVSQRAHARYLLYERRGIFNPILAGTRLGQQYVVDNWGSIDQHTLDFFRHNQTTLRKDLYKGVVDTLARDDDVEMKDVGEPFILPSSYYGGDRHMQKLYQNSMAIVRYFGKATFFITFTANPSWPEIINNLKGRNPQDRPELIVRVFNLKREELMNDLKTAFGKYKGKVWTLEFQVRGLPHVHILIFIDRALDVNDPDVIDSFVRAELLSLAEDPSGRVNELVKKMMTHGPCGAEFPNAPCMVTDEKAGRKICSKGFPKRFCEATKVNKDGYPEYRRRDNVTWTQVVNGREVQMDNRWIVPFNPYLLLKFQGHINVEICAAIEAVKYIHKYIYKGPDRVAMQLLNPNDELSRYLISRYIGPQQAAWRIMGFPIHGEDPAVQTLHLHLPNEQAVCFPANADKEAVERRLEMTGSTLMAFFEYNRDHPDGRNYLYQDFPPHYVYEKGGKEKHSFWKPRVKNFAIGRISHCSPIAGERYYLRLLLTSVKGPTSFEHLRTVDSEIKPTFRAACKELGLLENDDEWSRCFEEAVTFSSGQQLRTLFIVALANAEIADADAMWMRFRAHFCDDLARRIAQFGQNHQDVENPHFDYGLYLIKVGLDDFHKTPSEIGLQEHHLPWHELEGDSLILSELSYDCNEEQARADANMTRLNIEQRAAFDAITTAVDNDPSKAHFFVQGPAGTGKSFLYSTLCHHYRARNEIVLCVASSGIASLVLPGGHTAHSRFKIPLHCHEDSTCGVTKQHSLNRLIQRTKLIIWDEVPMQNKYNVEAVHRTLCDFTDNDGDLFGGVPVIFGGDFAQTVPVIKKGNRGDQVNASLRFSFLWPSLQVLHLRQNMRVRGGQENHDFAEWIAKMSYERSMRGKIDLPSVIRHRFFDRDDTGKVDDANGLHALCKHVYPDTVLADAHQTPEAFRQRAILTLRNDTAAEINAHIQRGIADEEQTFYAINSAENNVDDEYRLSDEFLQSIECSSLPPNTLRLKIGSPVMLIRNLYQKEGLCNGTRLTITHMGRRCLEARMLGGEMDGELRLIPRIKLTTEDFSHEISRTQFPVRLCFAITVNKSQGQTLPIVGVDLRTPCFGHGQLYVALSRVTNVNSLAVLLRSRENQQTENVVWEEVLLE